MKFLDQYHNHTDHGEISISAQQGSDFAKQVAGDFNPIHDPLSRRFCVPGDLLFALALKEYGLHKHMAFQFLDLVSADTQLSYPKLGLGHNALEVLNSNGKAVLGVQCSGGSSNEGQKIAQLLKQYVAFSGQNFPHILVPLMQEHGVMINPKRPLVIYQSMSFTINDMSFSELEITLEKTELKANGKRGDANLLFSIKSNGQEIGSGIKNLVLSGLRDYDEKTIQQLSDAYLASKKVWEDAAGPLA